MEYAIAHSAKMEIQRANNDDARIARREAILRTFTPTIQLSPLEGGVVQEIIVEEGAHHLLQCQFLEKSP